MLSAFERIPVNRSRPKRPMTDPKAFYRDYIACLNARRFDELAAFVAEEVTHNGRRMSWRGYADMIAADVAAIPDLTFEIVFLVAEADTIACRIAFDCTPQKPFLGLVPTGRRVAFAEHVFYRLRDGRIFEVFSLIDRDAIAAQLAGPAR